MKTYICDYCGKEYKKEWHEAIAESSIFRLSDNIELRVSPPRDELKNVAIKVDSEKIFLQISDFLNTIGDYCDECKNGLVEEIVTLLRFTVHKEITGITKN